MANPSIIIGRHPYGQQKQEITQQSVSKKHCRLTRIGNCEWEIEDIGSKYGTAVNGLPIVKTRVGLDTPIMLADFETSVRQLLGVNTSTATPTAATSQAQQQQQQPTEVISIRALADIYDNYQIAMKSLIKKRNRAQLWRMIPLQLLMPVAAMLSGTLIENTEEGNLIKGAIMVGILGLSGILTLRMFSVSNNQTDEQFDLNQQFQIDYVCPKCKNFFGAAKPYRALLNQGKCPYCKSTFAESAHKH